MEGEKEQLLPKQTAQTRQGGAHATTAEGCSYLAQLAARLSSAGRSIVGTANQELLGLGIYVCSTLFSTGMSLMAKIAGQRGVPVFQVVLIRSLFLIFLTAPRLIGARTNPFASDRQLLLLLRGALGFCSVSSLFWAVSLLPMAEATVLSFLAPVIAAVLSPLVLRERPSRYVLLALPCCVLGVLLVARPAALFGALAGQEGAKGRASALGVTVGLIQAFFSAAAKMCIRALSSGGAAKEPMEAIIFSMGVVSTLGSGIASAVLRAFVLPASLLTWAVLVLNGLFGYCAQVTLTAALQRAKAAPAIAMSYFGIVWSVLADIVVFGQAPTGLSILGAAVICGSGVWMVWSEKRAKGGEAAGGGGVDGHVQHAQEQEVALGKVGAEGSKEVGGVVWLGEKSGDEMVAKSDEEEDCISRLGSSGSVVRINVMAVERRSMDGSKGGIAA